MPIPLVIKAFKSFNEFPCKSGSVYSNAVFSEKLSTQEGYSDNEASLEII